jgi:hypothetical protein
MRRIRVDVPFRAAIGTIGRVSLNFDSLQVPKASLSIDLGVGACGEAVTASLDVAALRQLVDGMMDVTLAVERRQRLDGLQAAV